MDIFQAIRTYVLADTAIAAKVGTRFYPVKLPQKATMPAMTLQQISGVRLPPLRGRASLARPRFQFDVWVPEGVGSAFEESRAIGALLLARLEGRNVFVDDTSESPAVPRLVTFEFDSDQDLYDGDVDGGYFRYSADYFVLYQTGTGSA